MENWSLERKLRFGNQTIRKHVLNTLKDKAMSWEQEEEEESRGRGGTSLTPLGVY